MSRVYVPAAAPSIRAHGARLRRLSLLRLFVELACAALFAGAVLLWAALAAGA